MAVKPRPPGQTRRVPVPRDVASRRQRGGQGATEDDPTSGGAIVGNCGRAPDDQCGLTDPSECSIHGGARADPDDEEKLLRAIRRLAGRRRDGAPSDDEPPVAHEDSIRLAHKSLRTAKAYMAEGMTHHAKALNLLDGVVQALDEGPATDQPGDADPAADADKAAQLARAAELRAKHKPA